MRRKISLFCFNKDIFHSSLIPLSVVVISHMTVVNHIRIFHVYFVWMHSMNIAQVSSILLLGNFSLYLKIKLNRFHTETQNVFYFFAFNLFFLFIYSFFFLIFHELFFIFFYSICPSPD